MRQIWVDARWHYTFPTSIRLAFPFTRQILVELRLPQTDRMSSSELWLKRWRDIILKSVPPSIRFAFPFRTHVNDVNHFLIRCNCLLAWPFTIYGEVAVKWFTIWVSGCRMGTWFMWPDASTLRPPPPPPSRAFSEKKRVLSHIRLPAENNSNICMYDFALK